jgi:sucrose phosphorylase
VAVNGIRPRDQVGDPRTTLRHDLSTLYGDQPAASLLSRIDEMLAHRRPPLLTQGPAAWSERDAFLITYPDQVRQSPAPPLAVLQDVCRDHLADLVTGIHVLPFFASSSDDGFSVIDYRTVDPAFGGWEDLHRLGRSFRLMFDAVINHVSSENDWFRRFCRGEAPFASFFISPQASADLSQVVRPRTTPLLTPVPTAEGERQVWTTFSADQIDLNFREPQVLLEVLRVLLDYVDHGAGLLRLDAAAFLWKEPGTPCLHLPQTHALIRVIRAVMDLAAPHVLLVTETNVAHAENVSYFGDGIHEAQLVYNFALAPLTLDAVAGGSAALLSAWAANLSPPGPATCYFNFLASHDGIGLNPARGLLSDAQIDRLVQRAAAHGGAVSSRANADGSTSAYELNINFFDALSDPEGREPLKLQAARFIAAHAVTLSLAGVPGIYFHSLFGSRGWREGVRQTGRPRSINRQKLERGDLERDLRDPSSLRFLVFRRFARLLRARRAQPAFHPASAQHVLEIEAPLFTLLRVPSSGGAPVLCLQNLSPHTVTASIPPDVVKLSGTSRWTAVDGGTPATDLHKPLELAAYEVAWMCPEPAADAPARASQV